MTANLVDSACSSNWQKECQTIDAALLGEVHAIIVILKARPYADMLKKAGSGANQKRRRAILP
jgi:hypothetical protein